MTNFTEGVLYMKKTLLDQKTRTIVCDFLKRMAFLALSAAAFVLLGHYISRNTEYEYTDTVKNAMDTEFIKETGNICKLVLENEKLVIYSATGEPEIADADTGMLTEYDRSILENGISADREKISEIIESLMS